MTICRPSPSPWFHPGIPAALLLLSALACGGGSSSSATPAASSTALGGTPPIVNPGPNGNVPWLALPDCLGFLPAFQSEWWYYVGDLQTASGESFSLQVQALRLDPVGADLSGQLAGGIIGIGRKSDQSYLWSQGYGMGVADQMGGTAALQVQVGSSQYDVSMVPFTGYLLPLAALSQKPDSLHIQYVGGGTLGAAGSNYTLSATGQGGVRTPGEAQATAQGYAFDLDLTDQRGMVLEGNSGFVGTETIQTYEFAQPRLSVTGGTLTLGQETFTISSGNLWLDRQGMNRVPAVVPAVPNLLGSGFPAFAASYLGYSNNQMYLGNWLGLNLDNGFCMNLAEFWQPSAHQYASGNAFNLPPLTSSFGNLYFPLDAQHLPSGSAFLYGGGASGFDYDINLLRSAPTFTWQSPVSGRTYGIAWVVDFSPEYAATIGFSSLYLHALTPNCENLLPDTANAFWEGAVSVATDPDGTNVVGRGFMEQMGFN